MPELLFGNWDPILTEIADALSRYEAANPETHVALYRQNSASVRIRVIDPAFAGLAIGEPRESRVALSAAVVGRNAE